LKTLTCSAIDLVVRTHNRTYLTSCDLNSRKKKTIFFRQKALSYSAHLGAFPVRNAGLTCRLALLLICMLMPQSAWAENWPWTLVGVNYGTCSESDNSVISFQTLNNSSWGSNTIQTSEALGADGCQGTIFVGCVDEKGTQLYVWPHNNHKYISISQYAHSETVPAYARLNRASKFKVCMATARYYHGAGLYVFDNLTAATTTALDANRKLVRIVRRRLPHHQRPVL